MKYATIAYRRHMREFIDCYIQQFEFTSYLYMSETRMHILLDES